MCGRARIDPSVPTLEFVLLNYLIKLLPKRTMLLAPASLSYVGVNRDLGLGLYC